MTALIESILNLFRPAPPVPPAPSPLNLTRTLADIARRRGFYLDTMLVDKRGDTWWVHVKMCSQDGVWVDEEFTWPIDGNIWAGPIDAFEAVLTRLEGGAS